MLFFVDGHLGIQDFDSYGVMLSFFVLSSGPAGRQGCLALEATATGIGIITSAGKMVN
jgi:hypothetical protein